MERFFEDEVRDLEDDGKEMQHLPSVMTALSLPFSDALRRMPLRHLDFPGALDTSSHDLVKDFFVPALQSSVRYDRGVGYFSSGWLRANAQGMVEFAESGGRARWITSPILGEKDWEYLQKGEAARHDAVLREALSHTIADLAGALQRDTLSALAWMVADGILTFKLALPHAKLDHGEFHDKFGIFEDAEGDRISFNGSYNDSRQGLRNYESLKVFRSWDVTVEHVENDAERFRRLWGNEDPNLRVFGLPEAARAEIVRLRSDERPYGEPEGRSIAYSTDYGSPSVGELGIELWPHQKEALRAWEENDEAGLLNMATGSGKTVTALMAAQRRPVLFDEGPVRLGKARTPRSERLLDQADHLLAHATVLFLRERAELAHQVLGDPLNCDRRHECASL